MDVFAGCGGLSLGLMSCGWRGLFAVEKDEMAFETLRRNLIDKPGRVAFDWPSWLPRSAIDIETMLAAYGGELLKLRGQIDLLAGGPPCQGFSSAGRRALDDPRNMLFRKYLEFVDALKPGIVLIENVPGITYSFRSTDSAESRRNFSAELREALGANYHVHDTFLATADFGIPQMRRRFLVIGLDRSRYGPEERPFEVLEASRLDFLAARGLEASTSASEAISDLEIEPNGTVASLECPGFMATVAGLPKTRYQRFMRGDHEGPVSDTRLARHAPRIRARFSEIIHACNEAGRTHVQLSAEMRQRFGLQKKATRVMDPDRPSPTITSMPDDLLHYREPRTLTVRENARLQSFPDWFEFAGKYTTGGDRRKREVPRFTQVANAVPPLLAAALGEAILATCYPTLVGAGTARASVRVAPRSLSPVPCKRASCATASELLPSA